MVRINVSQCPKKYDYDIEKKILKNLKSLR